MQLKITETKVKEMSNDNYNYESPITRIQNQLLSEMRKNEEDQLMCEVRQAIGYSIDKSELIKALNYDRDQYEKGYQDGKSAGYQQAENERRKGHWVDVGSLSCMCSECGCKSVKESKYCPECGAYMKGETSQIGASLIHIGDKESYTHWRIPPEPPKGEK
jgi:flagellar biosynthesis/type III secretory pathway protein FliH